MPDMLVRLYDLPPAEPLVAELRAVGVVCRRAESYERSAVLTFVRERWPRWMDETEAAFGRMPATCYVAIAEGKLAGFACYNVTRPNFFGPTGVSRSHRKMGFGKALLVQCLEALRAEGYAYAIIGGVGPAEFYEKTVGATLIEGSSPGIYEGMLR
ncbi:MAG: GNAT family N-acetyltransferase [Dehalococcoidia bacterium]|nr:GNAT family N-acetyltransferase [Dehalococcoidia bacterium]